MRKAVLRDKNTTTENPQSIVESYFSSRWQLMSLLGPASTELINTVGTTGHGSLTELRDTLMQCYDTLPEKHKEKFWTLIVDYCILATPYGMPSRVQN